MKRKLSDILTYAPLDYERHHVDASSSLDLNAPQSHPNSRKAFIRSSQKGNEVLTGKRIVKRLS